MLRPITLSCLLLQAAVARACRLTRRGCSGAGLARVPQGVWAVFVLLISLLTAGQSRAATQAPMCDQDGASVVAPYEVPLADGGTLDELPCDSALYFEWLGMALSELTPAADKAAEGSGRGDPSPPMPWAKALPLGRLGVCPLPPVLARGWSPISPAGVPCGGFAPGVYRPPLASPRPASSVV